MITIFTIPKKSSDPHILLIQKNALESWRHIGSEVEVIVLEEEVLEKNEFGTPLVNSAFSLASKMAKNQTVMYSNADMIFTNDLIKAVSIISKKEKFLGVGRRIDLDIKDGIDFSTDWQEKIRLNAKEKGKLHSPAGIDYFIFKKDSLGQIPPLTIGRVGWDNWMIYNAKKNDIDVIDLTHDVMAIHQNHDPMPMNDLLRKKNPEALKNFSFLNGKASFCTTEDAQYRLENGILRKNLFHWLPGLKRGLR